jgi:hypothetical protein
MYVRILSALLVAGAALSAGSSAPAQQERSPKAAKKLAEALFGRTPGEPVACVRENARMTVIDDSTLLFRDRGIVYLQLPRGACRGLSRGMTLARNSTGATRLCSGDMSSIVDTSAGYSTDSCVFGEFIPYKKAD